MLPTPSRLSSTGPIGLYPHMASPWPQPAPLLGGHGGAHTLLRSLSPSVPCVEPTTGLQGSLSTHRLFPLTL